MKANTACCFVLAGFALWQRKRAPSVAAWQRMAAQVAAALVVLTAGATLIEYTLRSDFGIDQLLVQQSSDAQGSPFPGRMSLITAVALLLLGSALLVLDRQPRRGIHPALPLALGGGLIGLVALDGYVYGAQALYQVAPFSSIAAQTAFLVVLTSAGVLCACPALGVIELMIAPGLAGRFSRRVLPLALAIPLIEGVARLVLQRQAAVPADMVAVMVGTSMTLLLVLLLAVSAVWLRSAEAARDQAQLEALDSRRHTEEALHARQRLMSLFVDYSPAPIAMLDRDMRYVAVSRSWRRDYAVHEQDLIGRSHYDVFPEIPARWRDIHRRCLAGAVEKCEEDPFVRADGRTDWLRWEIHPWRDEDNEIAGIVIFSENITERKRGEEVRQQMVALIESADDAILSKSLDGVIRSWNPGAQRLLGYRSEEIIGQSITLLLPDDRQSEETMILDRIRNGHRVSNFETIRRRKDGSQVDVSLTISPILDRAGVIVGASKIMRDITERKHYVEQLRELNAELEARIRARTSELKERDVLLQEIHHRVKNNLQVVSSLINMQIRSLVDLPTRSALQQCQSRVQAMAQIHEMLYQAKDYARIPFAKYSRELTTRVLSASGMSPDDVSLVFDCEELSLAVDQAIPCALILNELVANTLKHAFPNSASGEIRVDLRPVAGDRVVLAVSDNGIGLSPKFDPQRTNSLGLQLVVTLVEQLDGHLEITGERGTTFRITFPLGPRT
jgi:PAS domain S-box-containing protein